MDERVVQLRIGLMVLATAIIAAILLFTFSGPQSLVQYFQAKNVFHVQFPQAPAVTRDTPVLKSGVRIGRVTRVRLPDEIKERELDDDVGAVVTIEIDRNRRIFDDEICLIKRNLLGDAVLEFVKAETGNGPNRQDRPGMEEQGATQKKPKRVVEPGSWIRGQVRSDPIQLVGNLEKDLLDALRSVAHTSDEIRNLVEKVNVFLGTKEELVPKQERLSNILDRALTTMESMENLAENASDVIGDENVRQQLKEAVDQLPLVLQEARNTLGQMSHTLSGMDTTVRLANRNLRKIEDFTGPLGEQGPVVIERLDRGAQKLELMLDEMYTFSKALNSPEGSLGRLISDPELYENLNSAVVNIEELTQQLRPVVWNARVFSDKIARHPELLGVRGALQPSPGTKGVPRFPGLRKTPYLSRSTEYPPLAQPR